MKKFTKILLTIIIATNLYSTQAQENNPIKSPKLIKAGEPSNFSINDQNSKTKWDFGNGNKDTGANVAHTYNKAGIYELKIENQNQTNTQEIQVYQEINLLIHDKNNLEKYINNTQTLANNNQNQIIALDTNKHTNPFINQEIILEKLTQLQAINFEKIDNIIIWTDNNNGINPLIQYLTKNQEIKVDKKNIYIVNNKFDNKTRLIRQQRRLKAKNMYVIKSPNLYSLADSQNTKEFEKKLKEGLLEYVEIKPENYIYNPLKFLSLSIDYLSEKGIPENLIQLLLLIPLICFWISFLKQIIGLSTIGVYLPIVITLCFLILGISVGTITMAIVFFASSLSSYLLNKVRMLYSPKTSLTIVITSLIYTMSLSLLIKFKILDIYTGLMTVFPTIIMLTMAEKFANIVNSKGLKSCFFTTLETYLVIILTYILCGGTYYYQSKVYSFQFFNQHIINSPELIILLSVFIFIIGRYTGLQVSEYFRFRKILDNIEE